MAPTRPVSDSEAAHPADVWRESASEADPFPDLWREDSCLYHDTPSAVWQQAYPLGNGHMGVMCHGRPDGECMELSELTCFSGNREAGRLPQGAPAAFQRARDAAVAGEYQAMTRALEEFIPERGNFGTNLPMGHLRLACTAQGVPHAYRRTLDLATGIVTVRYAQSGTLHLREAFLSHPDRVFSLRIEGLGADGVDGFHVGLDGAGNPYRIRMADNVLLLDGEARETMHSDGASGVRFHVALRVAEGTVVPPATMTSTDKHGPIEGGLQVRPSNGGVIHLLLAAATDFDQTDPASACRDWLDAACRLPYGALRSRHMQDVAALDGRCRLVLGDAWSAAAKVCTALPTDQRIERFRSGGADPGLVALLFRYGRYLLFSSSRETSPVPAPLQGVWNDAVACRIGWTCDMHLDINTQMNHWPAESTGLAACAHPLFRWIRDGLAPAGERTAKLAYGLDGWCAELVSNLWDFTAPYWHTNIAPYPTGGAWIAMHLWAHWLYTEDRGFLRDFLHPVLEGSARFFLGYLFENPATGFLESGPSISPESHFMVDGEAFSNSLSPTCEILVIREILDAYQQADHLLGLDQPLADQSRRAMPRLRPLRRAPDGTLAEWSHDFPAQDPQHRHTSHLLALYPFRRITMDTPELMEAARETLRRRTTPAEGWEDTGWARSMLMLYAARLGDGEAAEQHIRAMLAQLAQPNLLIRHPPTRGAPSFADVYELDGNTGVTACIAEMLVQNLDGEIHVLPALPAAWPEGRVSGLRAHGGWALDLCWHDGRLAEVRIGRSEEANAGCSAEDLGGRHAEANAGCSAEEQRKCGKPKGVRPPADDASGTVCRLRYGRRTCAVVVPAGRRMVLDGSLRLIGPE